MPSQPADNRRLIPLTAAFTPVPATIFTRGVEISEDGSGSAAGLLVKFPNDNFTQAYLYAPADQPVKLGNKIAHGNAYGEILGWPAQSGLNARAADVLVQVASAGADTVIRVVEYD